MLLVSLRVKYISRDFRRATQAYRSRDYYPIATWTAVGSEASNSTGFPFWTQTLQDNSSLLASQAVDKVCFMFATGRLCSVSISFTGIYSLCCFMSQLLRLWRNYIPFNLARDECDIRRSTLAVISQTRRIYISPELVSSYLLLLLVFNDAVCVIIITCYNCSLEYVITC